MKFKYKPQFTPGPWVIRQDLNFIEPGFPETVWSIYAEQGTMCICDTGPLKSDEAFFNAALIAQAPEMYDALYELLDILNDVDTSANPTSIAALLGGAESRARDILKKIVGVK